MKKIFKKLICAAITLCLTVSVSTMTAFALEYNRWTQAKYLTKDELLESTWKSILSSNGTYEEQLSDNTLILSYTYDELKKFINDFKVPEDMDFEVQDMPDAFNDYMEEKLGNTVIEPYSEKVIQYLKTHPNADLEWTDRPHSSSGTDSGYMEYLCYDKSTLVDDYTSKDSNDYMQYSDNDVSNILIWTYDQSKDKYICKDQNGKTVNSVAKYHLENETATSSSKPDTSSESTSKHTTDYSTVSNATVSGATETASADVSEINEVTAVYEDSTVSAVPETTTPDSAVAADDPNQMVVAESAVEEPMESSVVAVSGNNGNNVQNIILIVLGVLIVAGIVVIIVMLKKKGNKNES